MMDEFLECKKSIDVDYNNKIELLYYKIIENNENREIYGVRIEKKTDFETESEYAVQVTDNESVIDNIIRILFEGAVTPVSIFEIIDEFISGFEK